MDYQNIIQISDAKSFSLSDHNELTFVHYFNPKTTSVHKMIKITLKILQQLCITILWSLGVIGLSFLGEGKAASTYIIK